MNQPAPIDDLLRRRLQHAEAPPPAHVWPAVERALRRRRRRVIWFWVLGLGLAAASIFIWWWQTRHTTPPTAIEEHIADVGQPSNIDRVTTEAGASEWHAPRTTHSPEQASRMVHPRTGVRGHEAHATEPGAQIVLPRTGVREHEALAAEPAAQIVLPQTGVREHEALAAEPGAQVVLPKTGVRGHEAALMLIPRPPSTVNRQPFTVPRPPSPVPRPPSITGRKKKTPRYCYDFTNNPSALLVEAYAGPAFVQKTLFTDDPEFYTYRDQRKNTERFDWGFNAGARGALIFGRNFVVRAGVHYNQSVEIFEFIDPAAKRTIIIIDSIPDGSGGWTVKTSTQEIYGEKYIKTYNRFGILDIPVQAGMELRSGRTGISLHAGAALNVLFWKQGSMVGLNGQPASFTPASGDLQAFRPRLGLSVLSSLQWFYHLAPRSRIFIEPYYRQILKPVTLESYPIEQRNTSWGVQFGFSRIIR